MPYIYIQVSSSEILVKCLQKIFDGSLAKCTGTFKQKCQEFFLGNSYITAANVRRPLRRSPYLRIGICGRKANASTKLSLLSSKYLIIPAWFSSLVSE